MSVDIVGDSLVIEGPEEKITLAPLPKQEGEGIVMTRNIKGEHTATLNVYFERMLSKPEDKNTSGNKESDKKNPKSV